MKITLSLEDILSLTAGCILTLYISTAILIDLCNALPIFTQVCSMLCWKRVCSCGSVLRGQVNLVLHFMKVNIKCIILSQFVCRDQKAKTPRVKLEKGRLQPQQKNFSPLNVLNQRHLQVYLLQLTHLSHESDKCTQKRCISR